MNQGGLVRKVSVLVISIVILSMGIAAHADEKRILWDFNQLPELGVGQSRMVFGYNLGSSLQDDYSWRVVRPTLTQFQSVLSPCALDSTPDKNFSACIDSVQYRKLGTSNWNAATLSKVQLGQPTETITKPGSRYPVDVSPIAFDQKQFIPPGDKATIWSMSGSKHSSGEDYLVRARFIGNEDILQFHHVFPKAFLKQYYPDLRRNQVNDFSNLAFIGGQANREIGAKPPAEYLKKIIDSNDVELLNLQAIPTEGEILDEYSYDDFLVKRRNAIVKRISKLLS